MNVQAAKQVVEQSTWQNQHNGCWAVFIPLNDVLGAKFYRTADERDWAQVAQECAYEGDAAPAVGEAFSMRKPRGFINPSDSTFGDIIYGYITERVDTDCTMDEDDFERLGEKLQSIGFHNRDSSPYNNVGYTKDGMAVQFDFDPRFALKDISDY